jgi:hypothetical protein
MRPFVCCPVSFDSGRTPIRIIAHMNGVSKNRHGAYYVRKKVPKLLEQATAEVLGNGKSRQVFLKRSLDTKDLREANIHPIAPLEPLDPRSTLRSPSCRGTPRVEGGRRAVVNH